MTTDENRPTQDPAQKHRAKGERDNFAPETEAAQQGGTDSAKRQAERDWQHSSKESGE